MARDRITLNDVVPWGRSFQEYTRMFDLEPRFLPDSILDCGGGPSSFCSEANRRGIDAVAVDPIYDENAETLQDRIREVAPRMLQLMEDNPGDFTLDHFDSPREVVEARHEAMDHFLDDFQAGKEDGRYLPDSVKDLPFDSGEFDLALSSHFLFLYDEQLSYDFHREAIDEILRVAHELRVFPLTNLNDEVSRHLRPLVEEWSDRGNTYQIHQVDYEFQKGSTEMLILRKQ